MAYTKQTWADLPSKSTPINANRLTHMEEGIYDAAATADSAATTAASAVSGLDDKVDKVAGKGLSSNDYNDTDKGKVNGLGTAASKDSTNAVTSGSTDLVESGAVKAAIDNAVSTAYKPAGTKTCAELTSTLLVVANRGNVYNITDSGTTTSDFIEGAGKPIRAGDNVGICEPTSGTYKFDLLSGFIDLSAYQTKTLSTPISVDGESETTVEGALSAINILAEGNQTDIGNLDERVTNLENHIIYGFRIKSGESDPSAMVEYIADAVGMVPARMNYTQDRFEYGSWESAFFVPRPCMLKTDGTVDYYLNPNDYTQKADGSASDVADATYSGNAMMEWGRDGKKIWMKIVPDVDHLGASVYIADYQADANYHDWAFHNCDGVSAEHFYTPIFNGSLDANNKMRSISGQALMKKKTATEEVSYARANNAGADVLWDIEHYADITLINMLLVLMGKSVDTQAVFGEGVHTNGTEAINDTFLTGVHNTKGLFYGTNDGTCAANDFANCVKVFGMENWWGLQWRRYLGHVSDTGIQKIKLTYGIEDGSTATDYVVEGTPTGDGYKSTGATVLSGTSGDYIKTEYFTADGMFPCGALSGSATSYFCDGCWYNNSGVRVARRGGASSDGAKDGAFCATLTTAASNSIWTCGAALSCHPLAASA